MKRIWIFCLVLLFVMLAITVAFTRAEPPRFGGFQATFAQYSVDEQAIYLAVLDEMFKTWRADDAATLRTCFIQLNKKDAPSDLMKLLGSKYDAVDVSSNFKFGRGVDLIIGPIQFKSSDEATVEGSYLYGDLGANWGFFILKKKAGKWVVVNWKQTAIS